MWDRLELHRVSWTRAYWQRQPLRLRRSRLGGGRNAGADVPAVGGAPTDTSLSALRARQRAAAQEAAVPGFEGFGPAGAPFVLPGVNTATRTVDGKKYTTNVSVQRDPRSEMSAAQLVAQHDGALKDLKQSRDSVLVRPVAGLGYRQYPRL